MTRFKRNGVGTGQMNREIAEGLSQELRDVLDPLLREIESLNERIAEYDRRIAIDSCLMKLWRPTQCLAFRELARFRPPRCST
jgi:hypothetical protein